MKKVTKAKIATMTTALAIAFYAGIGSYDGNHLEYLIDVANFVGKVAFLFDNASPSKKED